MYKIDVEPADSKSTKEFVTERLSIRDSEIERVGDKFVLLSNLH